ncbi:MAG: Flp family type IVb pilin [Pseudomonadota bacterium]
MSKMTEKVLSFIKDEEGLTIVEYAVAGGLITVGAIAAFSALGVTVAGVITTIDTTLNAAQAPAG